MRSNERRAVTVAVTCIGGRFACDTVMALRMTEDLDVTIVGLDTSPTTKGRYLADAFAIVPQPGAPNDAYLLRLLEIVEQFGIQVIVQGSEGETEIISRHRQKLADRGVSLALSDHRTVSAMLDKGVLLTALAKGGIDVGLFGLVETREQFLDAARSLGYPDRRIVFKPRRGAGARGVLIADPKIGVYRELSPDRFCGTAKLEVLAELVSGQSSGFASLLAMPMYGPKTYDVDCIADRGKAVIVVPRLREWENPLSPSSEGCRIELVPQIDELIGRICKILDLHGACDFDVILDDDLAPRLIDASCRMSGSVGAAVAAGANIPAMAVRSALGMAQPKATISDGVSFRPFERMMAIGRHSP